MGIAGALEFSGGGIDVGDAIGQRLEGEAAVRGLLLQVLHEFGEPLLCVGAIGACGGAVDKQDQAGGGEGEAGRGQRALVRRAGLPFIVERAAGVAHGICEPEDLAGKGQLLMFSQVMTGVMVPVAVPPSPSEIV